MDTGPPRFHRELVVWQAAMELLVECYRLARQMPASERYCIAAQLRRAAVSVPSNIAEGHDRSTRGEYLSFLSIAHGSLMEVETLLDAADRLALAPSVRLSPVRALSARAGRLLFGLMRALRSNPSPSARPRRSPSPVPRPPSPTGPLPTGAEI